jgi:hypothetical protein
MGKTLLTGILMHLEPQKAEALNALAKRLDVQRSVLMREAIDDLLAKYHKVKGQRKSKKQQQGG